MARFVLDTTADEDTAIAAWLEKVNRLPGVPRTAESAVMDPVRQWVALRLQEHMDLQVMLKEKAPQITKEDEDAIRAILEKYPNESKR